MINLILFLGSLLLITINGFLINKTKQLSLEDIIADFILGFAVTGIGVFLLSSLGIKPIYSFFLLSIISIFYFYRHKPSLNINFKSINLAVLASIILSIVALTFYTYTQHYSPSEGLRYFLENNAHDSLWHAALQNQLQLAIPPENPIYATTPLVGYHYFTDIVFSLLSTISSINTISLSIRHIPLVIGSIFVLSNFLLAAALFSKKYQQALAILLLSMYSSQPYIFGRFFPNAQIHTSMFWLEQPSQYLVNPQLVLSFALLNVLIYFLIKKQDSLLRTATVMASLVGIKAHAIIVLLPSLLLYQLNPRSITYIKKALILSISVIAIALLIGSNNSSLPFFFSPGWFIQQMFTTADRLNSDQWELVRLHYVQNSATIHLVKHWLYGLAVFLIGNFGIAIVIAIYAFFKAKKQIKKLLLSMVFISITFSLLFLQSGIVWNSIQTSMFARIPLILLILLWLKNSKKYVFISITSILILISLPTIHLTYQSVLDEKNYQTYSPQLIQSIQSLNQEGGIKYIPISSILSNNSLIPAASNMTLYSADPIVKSTLSIPEEERTNQIKIDQHGTCDNSFRYLVHKNDQVSILTCESTIEQLSN